MWACQRIPVAGFENFFSLQCMSILLKSNFLSLLMMDPPSLLKHVYLQLSAA